ncbi:hypothetical protein [Chryseobacterium luquanense]|uniref:Lipoprotein n=1 Tax=Chryseobacterium luquanense TaxID=2983766 RepID=A0ABT3Y4K6_9FLAO|nr:hypothetical protein [Chryseobacterium luquanense]MCX8533081.1 hypothetical protein [Chryseobacterium luquanense]
MKQIIYLIILSSFLLGCRTKTKAISILKEDRTEIERIKIDSVKESVQNEETKKITDQVIKKQVDDFSGDIIIKGKSDSLNPLVYHNIVGKDTIQSISIIGNAEYSINNHYKKYSEENLQTKNEESSNFIQDFAKTAVSKATIKDVAAVVKNKTTEITSRGFQAGTWIVITIVVVFLLFIFFTYKYFKK